MPTEQDSSLHSPESSGKTRSWTDLYNDYGAAATDVLLNKPPTEKSLGFLRRCSVLATLCNYVYSYKEADIGSQSYIPVLLEGVMGDTVAVTATLLHFREAVDNGQLSGPQQFGMWSISSSSDRHEENFIAIVFRGTSSLEDVVVDANIAPHPISSGSGSESCFNIHSGFHHGATEHVEAIVKILRKADEKAKTVLPVWVSGHSLGGAYANALILHLLASRRTKELFKDGGGSCTFGAPMVVHSQDQRQLYQMLEDLEQSIHMEHGCFLSFHNIVNNADPVPRLLGGSLDAVHGYLESKLPQIKNVRQVAAQYQPFGQYHLVIGAEVRSLGMPEARGGVSSRLGTADYASKVREQLDLRYMWRMLYGTTGKGAGWTPHNMTSYQERLSTYMESLVRRKGSGTLGHQDSSKLYAPADAEAANGLGSSQASAKLGAEVRGLVQAGALQAGKAAYTWWTSSSSNSGSATLQTPSSSRWETSSAGNSSSAEKNQGKDASTWASKWMQKSRWS